MNTGWVVQPDSLSLCVPFLEGNSYIHILSSVHQGQEEKVHAGQCPAVFAVLPSS